MSGWADLVLQREKRLPLQEDAVPAIRAAMMRTLRGAKDEGHQIRGCCPVHGGDNPTAFVVSLVPGKIGIWVCLTHCGGGHYHKLTEQLGLEALEGREPDLVLTPAPAAATYEPPEGLIDWAPDWTWPRYNDDNTAVVTVIPASVMLLLGARLWCRRERGNDGIWKVAKRVWVPVYSGSGKLVGHVAPLLGKRDGTLQKCLNSYGKLATAHVVFAYQMRGWRPRTIVLVEGAADAMRLIGAGIPAVPLLGARKLSDNIISALAATYTRCIVCLDGDDKGRSAAAVVVAQMQAVMSARLFDIGVGADPADADMTVIDNLRWEVDNVW